ncbi:MAG: YigZ family protein [Muribaculum sp.]|nr:YigZ family protein [Muribaculum sp.]
MGDTFYTLDSPAEGWYKEKMSKFLAFAVPVDTVAEAKEVIASYQKKYHDARHVCWAYMLGAARNDFQSNDNGEPSGTAGKPILGQINSFNLTNIVIVVVRYFGGIKLGTSGLIVAYREAAREAITAGNIIECHEQRVIEFTFPYLAMNEVMKVVKDPEVKITSQTFDNACAMTIKIRADFAEALTARLCDIDGVSLCD